MISEKNYQVYIATNFPRKTVLYTGVTNNIFERDFEHRAKLNKNSFTARYNVNRIVYYENYVDVKAAIAREKQIKCGSRRDKINLIESINKEWNDLVEESWK